MVLLADFEPSGDYISARLQGIISAEEAERAFQFLLQRGYLRLNASSGVDAGIRYEQSEPVLDTGVDIFNHSFMQEHHSQVLQTWATHIEKLGYKNQELGLLNIPIPAHKLPELQEKLRQFQDEIIGWAQGFQDCDELVQLGTYLMNFPKKVSGGRTDT
jgi:hypothetical protein